MKQLLFPVKSTPRILTALLIAITIAGCSTLESSKTEPALDLPRSERPSLAAGGSSGNRDCSMA